MQERELTRELLRQTADGEGIKNPDGSVVFDIKDVMVPEYFSQVGVGILAPPLPGAPADEWRGDAAQLEEQLDRACKEGRLEDAEVINRRLEDGKREAAEDRVQTAERDFVPVRKRCPSCHSGRTEYRGGKYTCLRCDGEYHPHRE